MILQDIYEYENKMNQNEIENYPVNTVNHNQFFFFFLLLVSLNQSCKSFVITANKF